MDKTLQEAARLHASGEVGDSDMLRTALRAGIRAEDAVNQFNIDIDAIEGTRYDSNNSGGSFWLNDADWHALADGGWFVFWAKDNRPEYLDKDGRYMGQLATGAFAPLMTEDEAINSFRALTSQNPYAEGCECCGPPHNFY